MAPRWSAGPALFFIGSLIWGAVAQAAHSDARSLDENSLATTSSSLAPLGRPLGYVVSGMFQIAVSSSVQNISPDLDELVTRAIANKSSVAESNIMVTVTQLQRRLLAQGTGLVNLRVDYNVVVPAERSPDEVVGTLRMPELVDFLNLELEAFGIAPVGVITFSLPAVSLPAASPVVQTGSSSLWSTGLIVGLAVGGAALVALLGGVACCLCKGQCGWRWTEMEEDDEPPSTVPPPMASAYTTTLGPPPVRKGVELAPVFHGAGTGVPSSTPAATACGSKEFVVGRPVSGESPKGGNTPSTWGSRSPASSSGSWETSPSAGGSPMQQPSLVGRSQLY